MDNTTYQVKVIDLGYNLIVGGIMGINKIVYIHKYPPALHTTRKPNISNIIKSNMFEHNIETKLKKETVVNFWSSSDLYQTNGDWKGGEWGSNNLPTTSTNFCSGVFIGDILELKDIKCGIIPYSIRLSKPFEPDDKIIPSSEEYAWSTNITLHTFPNSSSAGTYSCYVCEHPMPQSAIDVLFVWENSLEEKYVKILKRGLSHPNVDMPNLLMPGAGEHREPGNAIGNVGIKSDAMKAIQEEIGIDDSVLSSSYLIPIGTFNKEKRDPRYWSFSVFQDSQIIKFGPERESETVVYVLYIKTNTTEKPKEIDCEDKIEVDNKYWIKLNSPILSNKELWMIPEHSYYFEYASNVIELFNKLNDGEKEQHKFNM